MSGVTTVSLSSIFFVQIMKRNLLYTSKRLRRNTDVYKYYRIYEADQEKKSRIEDNPQITKEIRVQSKEADGYRIESYENMEISGPAIKRTTTS